MGERAFLGVECSITNRRWLGLPADEDRAAVRLGQEHDLPDLLCRVLARQGVSPQHALSYLDPKLRDLMPDPCRLKDMERAVERFNVAVESKQDIAIFADYDVDGGSAGALLHDWLREVGLSSTLYVPARIDEGFGPNESAMRGLAEDHDLIICVDCGTTAHSAIAAAGQTDVIVIDHHTGDASLPPAFAIVNPNRQDEDSELTYLCATGVVYLFLVATNRFRRSANQATPDLMRLLDLVSLATVADVVPLVGLNRAFVRRGLEVMARRGRPGLRALADAAKLRTRPDEYHLGFVLGPRINAGGRIGQADLGINLLATADPVQANALAERLNSLNQERRDLVDRMTEQAIAQAQERGLDAPLVWAAAEQWHPGVVGIVASRLSERANRPAIVVGIANGVGKGSGRSVKTIDLGSCITRARDEGLLTRGGGHAMAAGLEVRADHMQEAMARISDLLASQGAADLPPRTLSVIGQFHAKGLSGHVVDMLAKAGPFGAGSPRPCFAMPNQAIHYVRRIGDTHLRVAMTGDDGAKMNAIAFNAFDSPLGEALSQARESKLHVAGTLQLDQWNGRRSPELKIIDASIV